LYPAGGWLLNEKGAEECYKNKTSILLDRARKDPRECELGRREEFSGGIDEKRRDGLIAGKKKAAHCQTEFWAI